MARKKAKSGSSRKRESYTAAPSHVGMRVREGLLLLTLAVSAFMLLALFTYHTSDPGWSYITSNTQIANAGGRVGAWLADFTLYLCGILAYLFPLMLSFIAWVFYYQQRQQNNRPQKRYPLLLLRLLGFVLILAAGCSLATLYVPIDGRLPFNAGGILGTVLSGVLVGVFSRVGTALILIACLLIGVTLFTGLSWFQMAERIGALVLRGVQLVYRQMLNIPWQSLFKSAFAWRHKASEVISDAPAMLSSMESGPSIALPSTLKKIPAQLPEVADVAPAAKPMRAPVFEGKVGDRPKLSLLDDVDEQSVTRMSREFLQRRSLEVESRLADFGVQAKVVMVHPGPVVTRYELQLAAGTKVNRVTALVKDLARSLSVTSVRVVEVIPGKSVIGLELPNEQHEMVRLRDVLGSEQYKSARSALTLALGKDIAGYPVVVDLAKMPHLLVAGTTGSGKSVGLNAMLLSLLYKSTPKELRLILIDPKMLELASYAGIPHLLTPVVTDMKDAASALRWCVVEMERRYRLMAALAVRNMAGYNQKVADAQKRGEPLMDDVINPAAGEAPQPLEVLPQIVVMADEFADMMVVVGKKVETLIVRLAQKARAAGIHLIFATQRPSVDVITGLIKANIPTRIAFQVSSKVDSRTILDQQGAEQLLGQGDMLYVPPGSGVPGRVHGAYVDDDEVHRVVAYLKKAGEPDYLDDVLDARAVSQAASQMGVSAVQGSDYGDSELDELYDEAVAFITKMRRVSISSIQRRFKVGYNRSARIVEAMEAAGVVSGMEANGNREVLAPPPPED